MSERLEAFARRVREVQKWKVLYGEKQRLLGKSLKNSTRLMIELIQLERRKPEDVRLVKVMPGLLDALSREKQILERLGASNATTRDHSGFRDFLQRLSREQTTRAQGAGLGGAMFQQAAPTSQLHEENGAVDKGHRCSRATQARRCKCGGGGIFGTRRRGEGAEVRLGETREITRAVGQLGLRKLRFQSSRAVQLSANLRECPLLTQSGHPTFLALSFQ